LKIIIYAEVIPIEPHHTTGHINATTLVVAGLALLLSACGPTKHPELALHGAAMGTTYNVTIVNAQTIANDPPDVAALLENLNRHFSTYDPDSALSSFNQYKSTEWFTTTSELCNVLADARYVSELTVGSFDVTVGSLVNLWGFGPGEIKLEPPTDSSILAAHENAGYAKLHTRCDEKMIRKDHENLYVDLSGYAKGFAVDVVASHLTEHGYSNFLVELGGEIRVSGLNARGQAWRIAIERPDDEERLLETALSISNTSLATSGDYRNFFEFADHRYSHTIDPRTARPIIHNTASVTVVENSAARADALATALLVMGHEAGFRFAAENSIAAYFLVRHENGFDGIATPKFEPYFE
jgi:thiamine biosynthesis lipoprotein